VSRAAALSAALRLLRFSANRANRANGLCTSSRTPMGLAAPFARKQVRGGAPRDGARSAKRGAATGGGGPQAPPTRNTYRCRAHPTRNISRVSPDPEHLPRAGSPDPETCRRLTPMASLCPPRGSTYAGGRRGKERAASLRAEQRLAAGGRRLPRPGKPTRAPRAGTTTRSGIPTGLSRPRTTYPDGLSGATCPGAGGGGCLLRGLGPSGAASR
jgi:hypothetical protein